MNLLPPKPVAEVLGEMDRFACVPYKATVTARTCLSRQAMLDKPKAERSGDYLYCEGCGDGRLIRLRVKDRGPDEPAKAKSSHNFISGTAHRRGRQPKAPDPLPQKTGPTPMPVAVLPVRPDRAASAACAARSAPLSLRADGSNGAPLRAAPPPPEPAKTISEADLLAGLADDLEGMEARARALVHHIRSTRAKLAAQR